MHKWKDVTYLFRKNMNPNTNLWICAQDEWDEGDTVRSVFEINTWEKNVFIHGSSAYLSDTLEDPVFSVVELDIDKTKELISALQNWVEKQERGRT